VLLLQPKILLLDEPTKGLDAEFKQIFAAILKKLTAAGVSVVMASHDVEFCAEWADRCALFFDGDIVTENTPRAFFSGNSFYTTSANRMARDVMPEAVTAGDIVLALGGELPRQPEVFDTGVRYEPASEETHSGQKQPKRLKLPAPNKFAASAFAMLLLVTVLFMVIKLNGFRAFVSGGNEAAAIADENAPLYVGIMLALSTEIIGLTLALTWKREKKSLTSQTLKHKTNQTRKKAAKRTARGKLSKRTISAAVITLLAIPATIFVGAYFFGDRKYYFISLLIILETMLPFALLFEGRKPQARELVVIAAMCAIAVAGRTAFFMLPQFKPVIAIVIIAGVAFGGETGFLVGAMTGFVSNFFFGQGPWTPWQMFAFGIIGFLAGVLSRKGLLRRSPAPLAVFGAFAAIVIYGGIMNPSFVIIYQGAPTRDMFLAVYLQGIPFDLVHAAATVAFLLIISQPMLEKLDRIKVKYGLIE
jgi:energy-coupling factor transport system ATP-binding protein